MFDDFITQIQSDEIASVFASLTFDFEIIWTLRGWIVSLMSKNILRACLKNELYG